MGGEGVGEVGLFVDAERREGRSVGAPVLAGVGCLVGCRIRGGNFSARSTTDVCLRSELQRKLRGLAAAGGEISFSPSFHTFTIRKKRIR